MTPPVYVGIDVSKDTLDVAVRRSGEAWRSPNTDADCAAVAERLAALRPALVVLGSTGGLERLAAGILAAAGLTGQVVRVT